MPLQTLSLRNYGVFRNVELLGLSPLTVVVGANGAGKTTLFRLVGVGPTAFRSRRWR